MAKDGLMTNTQDGPSIEERHRIERWLQLALFPKLLEFLVDDLVDGALQNGDGFSPAGFTKRAIRMVPEWETLFTVWEEFEKDASRPFLDGSAPLAQCNAQLRLLRVAAIDAARDVFQVESSAELFLSKFHDEFLIRRLGAFCASTPRLRAALEKRYQERYTLLKSRATGARLTKAFWSALWELSDDHWTEKSFGVSARDIHKVLEYLVDPDVTIHDSIAIVFAAGHEFSISRLLELT